MKVPRDRWSVRGRAVSPGRTGPLGCVRVGGERGASTVEAAVAMPVVLMMTFLLLQGALVAYGHTMVEAAAQEAAREVAQGAGTPDTGRDAATAFLAEVTADGDLEDLSITIDVTEQAVTVKVTAATKTVVGYQPHVTGSATMPLERLTW